MTKTQIPSYKCSFLAGLSFILTIFLFSCEPSTDVIPEEEEGQLPELAILFESDYVNHAWGYQHSGWFLDNHGKIRKYEMPDQEKWNKPDNDGFISKEDLAENFELANTLVRELARSTVKEKEGLIAGSLDGEMSDPVNRAADMGSFGWYTYLWDADKEMYKRQVLGIAGDWEQFNLATDAQALLQWLKTIQVN